MLFNSLKYMAFLPTVFILYWMIPHRFRWGLLLISSYYFYMLWRPRYIILIMFTTGVSYLAARLLEYVDGRDGSIYKKKMIVLLSTIVCLIVLFVFKYFGFFLNMIDILLKPFGIYINPALLNFALPVGISFYTFQTIGYIIDVYRGEIKAERHLGIYATYVSFFPQLVAGPIERAGNLLEQIRKERFFDAEKATEASKLILWGFYKKLIVADQLGVYVDTVYSDLGNYKGLELSLAIFFFTLQIYCDFSGYTDIALGSAKLLGIDLMQNFNCPYFSTSVREFWSRWHISLSTWFRDYVYIPLGGNRCSKARRNCNVMITFLLSGLWHGANWTFVVWGAVHGLAQVLENCFDKALKKVGRYNWGKVISGVVVFAFCNLALVFFRAESISDALYVFRNLFQLSTESSETAAVLFHSMTEIGFIVIFVFILFVHDITNYTGKTAKSKTISHVGYVMLAVVIVVFAQKGVANSFVYFQF